MKSEDQSGTVWVRIGLCIAILALGIGGAVVFKKMKKPPVKAPIVERAIPVEGIVARKSDFPVQVSGFGEVGSRSVVTLSSEVAGKVISIHPRLEVGEIIEKDEVLVALDDRDFRLDYETAKSRLDTLRRDLKLAEAEYKRLKGLYQESKVGSLSAVQKAESAVNATTERISQVEQNLESAKLRLERSVIRAPFTCRVTGVMIEQHEYVTPGRNLVTISDDTALEVVVSLDSRDVINWLEFDQQNEAAPAGWFDPFVNKECRIAWTENEEHQVKGKVDRIVRFDPQTRTMLVAVRLEESINTKTPVIAGMFCRVMIPGLTLENVIVVPRQAVSFENTVYVAVEQRLHTRPVKVARLEKDKAVIAEGINPGETVIITRLEEPLENSLLSVNIEETPGR